MKKQLLLFVCLLSALMASAYDAKINGVYYDFDTSTKEAEVTSGDTKYTGLVKIPATVRYENVTYSVTSIGDFAFSYCSGLTSLTIPNSVTSIGGDAFRYCSGLTSLTIPNSVTSIGNSAFEGCKNLEKVIAPDLTAWCNITFGGFTSNPLYYAHSLYSDSETEIKALVIPDGVTSIGQYAFVRCSAMTSLTIPNSVTSIGENAFYKCTNITSLNLNCKNIGNWFSDIKANIKTLGIGEGITNIAESTFEDWSSMTSISLPKSLQSVGNNAFKGCTQLTEVHITDLDAFLRISFGWYAPLFYAHHLYLNGEEVTGEVVFPSGITSVSNVIFEGCYGITSVVIPEGVTSIGQAAFKSCTNLKSVTLPSTLKTINAEAFQNCSGLTSVTIPNSVTSVGDYAFSGCI